MTVTFFGHSDFIKTDEYEQVVLDILEEKVGNRSAEMYLGGYGSFDSFAYDCCKKYQKNHPNTSLIFVTPYLSEAYQRNHLDFFKTIYDSIIYPELEDKPKKFAISYRNKYMAEKADFIIVYIIRSHGGAYSAYNHAKRKNKEIFNIAQLAS